MTIRWPCVTPAFNLGRMSRVRKQWPGRANVAAGAFFPLFFGVFEFFAKPTRTSRLQKKMYFSGGGRRMSIALVENGQRVKRKKSQGVNVESDQEDKTVSLKVKKNHAKSPNPQRKKF